jgi:hypothetical protein
VRADRPGAAAPGTRPCQRAPGPLTAAEREALPWRIARQRLWGIGGWVAQLDDQDTARAHARSRFPAIACALQLIAGIPAWHAGLS